MEIIQLKFENGVFVPLGEVPWVDDGDIIAFRAPDPDTVYLCKTDRLAALESGTVVLIRADEAGAEPLDA